MSQSRAHECESFLIGIDPDRRSPRDMATPSEAATLGDVHEDVKHYYGKRLQSQGDLQTKACVTPATALPPAVRAALANVHHEVVSRYYGCGLVVPEELSGCRVLDLGSGSGRDCFALSQLVGEDGHVTGIDMTPEQLEVARRHVEYHTKLFGFSRPNVEFLEGYIERLGDVGLQDQSYDVIVSNCVVNLAPDKGPVLREAFRVLKDGGELYFSDIYADRALPEDVRRDKELWGECLGGALHWRDLLTLAAAAGFLRPRLVSATLTELSPDLQAHLGGVRFVSATYRLFRVPPGAVAAGGAEVVYNGGIEGSLHELTFDAHTTFPGGRPVTVDAELAAILRSSRLADAFMIRPATKQQGGDLVQEETVDPFALLQREGAKGAAAQGCCAGGGGGVARSCC
uniref:Arsenite methyltransferase n=2 Tax=Petromyzon marinus TaxID=7757 RepID=A0AAJ7WSE2_PETMA|nr:arsenite methyltransferase isoform X1 [Petromyzon marinus]